MRKRRYNRLVCEDLLRVDIRELSFSTSAAPAWQYPVATIGVSVTPSHARVLHKGLDYFVAIKRTLCNYGGDRPWFVCPTCGDRRAVLYASHGRHLGCRHCLKLLYLSECEDEFGRALLKVRKLERDLCESAGGPVCAAPMVDKIKGQHLTTYRRNARKLELARTALYRTWQTAQQRS